MMCGTSMLTVAWPLKTSQKCFSYNPPCMYYSECDKEAFYKLMAVVHRITSYNCGRQDVINSKFATDILHCWQRWIAIKTLCQVGVLCINCPHKNFCDSPRTKFATFPMAGRASTLCMSWSLAKLKTIAGSTSASPYRYAQNQ